MSSLNTSDCPSAHHWGLPYTPLIGFLTHLREHTQSYLGVFSHKSLRHSKHFREPSIKSTMSPPYTPQRSLTLQFRKAFLHNSETPDYIRKSSLVTSIALPTHHSSCPTYLQEPTKPTSEILHYKTQSTFPFYFREFYLHSPDIPPLWAQRAFSTHLREPTVQTVQTVLTHFRESSIHTTEPSLQISEKLFYTLQRHLFVHLRKLPLLTSIVLIVLTTHQCSTP